VFAFAQAFGCVAFTIDAIGGPWRARLTRTGLKQLETTITVATGADKGLDTDIHEAGCGARPGEVPPYTASVDACLVLIHERLTEWHWHIGYGPRGFFPYAMLTNDSQDEEARAEMAEPTVPLAMLGAIVKAPRVENKPKGSQPWYGAGHAASAGFVAGRHGSSEVVQRIGPFLMS